MCLGHTCGIAYKYPYSYVKRDLFTSIYMALSVAHQTDLHVRFLSPILTYQPTTAPLSSMAWPYQIFYAYTCFLKEIIT